MTSKIELYREILEEDPASRVFFPLAKILAQNGEKEEAAAVLTKALGVHPEHLEARFFLVELLTQLGRGEEGTAAFEALAPLFSKYPSVWSLWASKATGLSRDAAVALRFVAQNLAGNKVSFFDLLEKGLAADAGAEPAERPEKPDSPDFEDFPLRGAAEVQALAKLIQDEEEALSSRATEIKALAGAETASAQDPSRKEEGKTKLLSMLEALADRLDARAAAS